jgi:hypothetical protein
MRVYSVADPDLHYTLVCSPLLQVEDAYMVLYQKHWQVSDVYLYINYEEGEIMYVRQCKLV